MFQNLSEIKPITQKFMISPKQLRNTIKPTQNIRTLLSILVTSKHSGKVSQDNWKTYNFPTVWICSHCHACQGKVGHPTIYYLLGKEIPLHFHNSPVAQVELSHLKVEKNEPRYSDSTVLSIKNITSHLHFFKALTFKSSKTT